MRFIFFLLLLVVNFADAQTTSLVADRIRAAEYLRIGSNTSQKVFGFDLAMPLIATNERLLTTKAVKDFITASFIPLGSTAGGDLGGTFPNPSVTKLNGNAVTSLLPTSGQALIWNGVAWSPSTPVDNSVTNELQTISISGQDIMLSNGGGTVAVPTDGNGIYSGSGVIPEGTVAEIGSAGSLSGLSFNAAKFGLIGDDGGGNISSIAIENSTVAKMRAESSGGNIAEINLSPGGNSSITASGTSTFYIQSLLGAKMVIGTAALSLTIDDNKSIFTLTDTRPVTVGMEYTADYSAGVQSNPRSLPDMATLGIERIVSEPTAAAANATALLNYAAGTWYIWDDGDAKHVMIVK